MAPPTPRPGPCRHTAALYGSEACVQLLLARGARVAALNGDDGTTALHDAAAGGYTAILRTLVDAARRRDAAAPAGGGQAGAAGDGEASTSGAAAGGDDGAPAAAAGAAAAGEPAAAGGEAAAGAGVGTVDLDAFVNAQDSEGETPLHNAARGGHAEAVRYLLSLGADPLLPANDGSLPIDEAQDEGVAAILQDAMDAEEGEEGGAAEAGAAEADAGEAQEEAGAAPGAAPAVESGEGAPAEGSK